MLAAAHCIADIFVALENLDVGADRQSLGDYKIALGTVVCDLLIARLKVFFYVGFCYVFCTIVC